MKGNAIITFKNPIRAMLQQCIAIMITLLSCTGTGTRPSEKDLNPIVLRGFLYAGQPVKNILLMNLAKSVHDSVMKTIRHNDNTFNQTDTVDTLVKWLSSSTIDNAEVTISSNGESFRLSFGDSGKYEDRSAKLIITAGQTYRIDVVADGRHAWAETTVPSKASGLRITHDTIYADTTDENDPLDSCELFGVCSTSAERPDKDVKAPMPRVLSDKVTNLTITWDNPYRRCFYYRCHLDPNLPGFMPQARAAQYTTSDSLTVTTVLGKDAYGFPPQIIYFLFDSTGLILPEPGNYKMVIYSAPPEFGDVIADINRADSMKQDQWVRSPSNVIGGLGYFTSFSIDSLFFTIVASANAGGAVKNQ
jgi:hypothetical protein